MTADPISKNEPDKTNDTRSNSEFEIVIKNKNLWDENNGHIRIGYSYF